MALFSISMVAALPVVVGSSLSMAAPLQAAAPIGTVTRAAATHCATEHFALLPTKVATRKADALLRRMTLAQEIDLLHGVGQGTAPSGSIGATTAIPSLGIPALNQEDGPAGVGDGVTGVTQLPAPEDLAATFDPTAAKCYGQVIGLEMRRKGFNLDYGPTVNIVRLPQWGRAFESLGEDPALTGAIGSAEIVGIQRTGTMAQVKHYVAYNQETDRDSPHTATVGSDDVVVSAKALHEIYLRAWNQLVAALPASVMCAYSSLDGSYDCQNAGVLQGYLDGTLGFGGFVGSDYEATHSTAASLAAGLDQEQPESIYFGQSLLAAVKAGTVSRSLVNTAALRILTQMERFRLMSDDAHGSVHADGATAADSAVAAEVAEEGTVLLKDADGVLPLSTSGSGGDIAVIGPAASTAPVSAGSGSSTVLASHVVTPLSGIRSAVAGRRSVSYSAGLPPVDAFTAIPPTDLSHSFSPPGQPFVVDATLTAPETGPYELSFTEPDDYIPITLSVDGQVLVTNPGTPPRSTYVGGIQLVAGQTYTLSGQVTGLRWLIPSQIDPAIATAAQAARRAAAAVVVVGDGQESEAADRPSLSLPGVQNELISAVAAANPKTVVVIDAGGPVTMPWLDQVAGVVDAWYPGQVDGTALGAILVGDVNPSGHLPITFPTSLADDPITSTAQFPGTGSAVDYTEGVDVGYRWYDATGTTPLFPFGFGLSYASFSYADPVARVSIGRSRRPVVTVRVRVTNTGRVKGADVAQCYVGQPLSADEPPRQLEAFQRVSLSPGQAETVTFHLSGNQLGYYDTVEGRWAIAAGRFKLWMGDSSALAQLPARAGFTVARPTMVGAG